MVSTTDMTARGALCTQAELLRSRLRVIRETVRTLPDLAEAAWSTLSLGFSHSSITLLPMDARRSTSSIRTLRRPVEPVSHHSGRTTCASTDSPRRSPHGHRPRVDRSSRCSLQRSAIPLRRTSPWRRTAAFRLCTSTAQLGRSATSTGRPRSRPSKRLGSECLACRAAARLHQTANDASRAGKQAHRLRR